MIKQSTFWVLGLCLLLTPGFVMSQCMSINVTSPNGTNPIRITVGDGIPDVIQFENSGVPVGTSFAYAITDASFNILNVTSESQADFEGAGEGGCWVWGFSYTGDITAQTGDSVFRTRFSTGCWTISRTAINLIRTSPEGPTVAAQLFASSNTQGLVGVYNILSDGSTAMESFASAGLDADGIYYDKDADVLYQLNRIDNVINAYSNVSTNPTVTATSTSDFMNGREIAVVGSKLVVAQDANDSNGGNKLLVYNISPTSITLDKIHDADINLWGIHADGGTLYAIEDNSNRLAVYENFFNQPAGAITPTSLIDIEGIVRTHGITYYAETDMMLLTDVGAASSPTDGAFTVIRGFGAASADGTVSLDEQTRVEGENSLLGNPVDIAYDSDRMTVYLAERANGGGRILGFTMPMSSGDATPSYSDEFAGASAVYFAADEQVLEAVAQVFASSNNQGLVGLYNILENNTIDMSSFASAGLDADGIHYDKDADVLYQLNRTDNVINAYSNVSTNPTVTATSSSDFINGREIAVMGDQLVVAQDANDANGGNQFFVYNISPTSITLDRVYDADINLWGIHAAGNVLFAIEDNSNNLAIYNDFLNNPAGAITPSATVVIEGIVRTHGITYYAPTDMMLLTDVGAASSATDGAFTVIRNFVTASLDGTVSLSEQTRIEGDATFLGNPVDIAVDKLGGTLYIAERANDGGRILGFDLNTTGGNVAPTYNNEFAGASAVYFSGEEEMIVTPAQGNQLLASSNNQDQIGVYNVANDGSISMSSVMTPSTDADGIYYDTDADVVYQLDRINNVINAYSNFSTAPTLTATSTSDFINGREIAVSNGRLVVAQDANDANGGNQFFIYNISPTSITLDKIYDVDINLWGIHVEGDVIFAIVDNSNQVAIFNDFFNNAAGAVAATATFAVENLVRTHGLTYDAIADRLVLTDVGAASSPDDGAIVIIDNLRSVSIDGTVSDSEQVRISGATTFLGNPVDVAYDSENEKIYVAERANGGGRILGFDVASTSGEYAPFYNDEFGGASAVYYTGGNAALIQTPVVFTEATITPATQQLLVYPNPTSSQLTVNWAQNIDNTTTLIRIIDNQGKTLLQQTMVAAQGANQIEIDVTSLPTGIYQIFVEDTNNASYQRFLKN